MQKSNEKARIYDELLRESDRLQFENSKLKALHVTNIPDHVQKIIDENMRKINLLVRKLEDMFH